MANVYQMVHDVYRTLGMVSALNNTTNPVTVNYVLERLREGEDVVIGRLNRPRLYDTITSVADQIEYALSEKVIDNKVLSVEVYPDEDWSLPLEFTTLERLRTEFDLTDSTTDQNPSYYYLRYDDTASTPVQLLGIYPALDEAVTDGIRVTYAPDPEASIYIAGYGIAASTTTATLLTTAVTLSAAISGLAIGMQFGVVPTVGDASRTWYTITALTGSGPTYTEFTISPTATTDDTGSSKKWVIATHTSFGRAYPSVSKAVVAYAAATIASDEENPREQKLFARFEQHMHEAKKRLYGWSER